MVKAGTDGSRPGIFEVRGDHELVSKEQCRGAFVLFYFEILMTLIVVSAQLINCFR